MKISNLNRYTTTALVAVATLFAGTANAVPGDFDADGKSDLSVTLVDRTKGTTAWLTRLTNGDTPKFWTFNKAADALASGRFYTNDSKYYPAIVRVTSSTVPLEWTFKTPTNTEIVNRFGLPGDIISNLGDWDGDGREDVHVVRKGSDNVLNWYVFLTGYATTVHFTFGVDGDQVGVSDTDGDGVVEMVALRDGFYWYVRKPFQSTFTTTQWGLNGDIPLLPRDLNGDNLPEFIISRKTGSGQVAYVKFSDGSAGTQALGQDTSVPQLGYFGPNSNFAWSQRDTGWTAIQNADLSVNAFRFGIPTNALVRPDGTVVQPTSDATFKSTTSSSGGSSGGGATTSCGTTYSSGWLLKPAAQDTGGSRLGKPLILFSRNYPSSSCLNVIATNGTVLGKYGKFSANRYYSGYGCGSGYSASKFAELAVSASGSKNIYIQDPSNNACYGAGPADGRTDRR